MFSIPISTPSTELIAWYAVRLDRLRDIVEVQYGHFLSPQAFAAATECRRPATCVSIRGTTAQKLLTTSTHTLESQLRLLVGQQLTTEALDAAIATANQNQLYDWVRALIGRLLIGTATEQELADCDGWQALAESVLVPGVTHLDPDPFPLEPTEEEGGDE